MNKSKCGDPPEPPQGLRGAMQPWRLVGLELASPPHDDSDDSDAWEAALEPRQPHQRGEPQVTPFSTRLYVNFGAGLHRPGHINFEEASRDQWLPGPSDDDKRAQWMALLLDPDIQKLGHHPDLFPDIRRFGDHPDALVEIDSSFIKFETCPALGAAGEPAAAAGGSAASGAAGAAGESAAAAGGSAASGAAPEQLKGPRAPLGTTRRALGP